MNTMKISSRVVALALTAAVPLLVGCNGRAAEQHQAEVLTLQEENQALRTELRSARIAHQEADARVSQMAERLTELSSRMEQMRTDQEEFRQRTAQADGRVQQATQQLDEVQSELMALRSSLARCVTENERLQDQLAQLQEQQGMPGNP